jgi:GTPase SAR1 family protein/predicted transcriptional regulator
MRIKKKIVLLGPSGSGKTTIKKVYFEMANPINLLEFSLKPTKGVNSSTYSFFKSNLGVFDLAGQENQRWLETDKKIFGGSSIIICVFDVTDSLESVIPFLIKILLIIKELKIQKCNVIILLHKIDLVNNSYINIKFNAIKSFLEEQFSERRSIKIYRTSITKEFFYDTYNMFLEILTLIHEKDLIPINKEEFHNLKIDITIILKFDDSTRFLVHELSQILNINFEQINFHLERLKHLGLVKMSNEKPNSIELTGRAYCFKFGLERERKKIQNNVINKGMEIFHTFLNLNEQIV